SDDLVDFSVVAVSHDPVVARPRTPGMPAGLADPIAVFPFNDLPGPLEALERRRGGLATGIDQVFLTSAGVIVAGSGYQRGISDRINTIGQVRQLALSATGYGSNANIHLAQEPPGTFRQVRRSVPPEMTQLYWALLERGYAIAPRGQFSTCALTTEAEVDGLL